MQDTIEALPNKITQMSSMTPIAVTLAIHAVAFILKDHAACELVESAAKQITEIVAQQISDTAAKQISDSLSSRLVDHIVAAISSQVALIHTASQALVESLEEAKNLHATISQERDEKEDNVKTTVDRIKEAADALYSSVKNCQTTMQLLTPSLDTMQTKIDSLFAKISDTSSQQITMSQPTYSTVVAAHLPPTVDKAVGRAAIRAHKILLDPSPASKLKEMLAKVPPNLSGPYAMEIL
ncbi:uncharacterized protein BJ212DRAFT_1303485 [Suillus subaureus]|uniref:Uncharacterized protein n=1 Tax=Suillus subaureus TaxID=48587 RepID=A0A9P7DZX0_9AGAM|nr:uncharacterized protein BJ212DRAFT_1303485 [Suillus subaureus]KAG1807255.1 hypothetical protein BJ212DRAFT_1303485 [Suillus subaureus]